MRNDERLAVLETTILNINSSLMDIKHDVRKLDDKLDETKLDLSNRIDETKKELTQKMDSKFHSVENRLWSNFLWLMGMIIGLAGLIAHTQHWI